MGQYIIRCTKPGYEEALLQVNLALKKTYDVGDIYMQKNTTRQLSEVVVKGTRIRMFYKGDTLIYNASAFVLPDGSMLDDLVKSIRVSPSLRATGTTTAPFPAT
jgi:predicted nucleotidyltransferase